MDELINFSSFYQFKYEITFMVCVFFITSCREHFWQPHKETLISYLAWNRNITGFFLHGKV